MSLRSRFTLAVLTLVAATALLAWLISTRAVLQPFARAVGEAMTLQAVHIAEEVDDGVRFRRLEKALGVEITRVRRPPSGRARNEVVRGRQVWRGRRTIVVESDEGLLEIRRALDIERPARRLPLLLLFPSLIIILIAVWIVSRSLVPLERATGAMRKVAEGDLDHRLEEGGPRELQEAARSFNAMTDRVQTMLHHERQLLAGLSHELRTPLTRLQLELALLEDQLPAERQARMEQDLRELDELVGEAVELSRLQLGERTLDREPVHLAEALADCDHDALTVQGNATIDGDPKLIRRLLRNLLSNASKYAPGPVNVTLAPGALTLRDHGPGVPENELDQLFHPFYRSPRANHVDGLGLGLMIVRQIAQLHGADITAKNATPGLAITLTW